MLRVGMTNPPFIAEHLPAVAAVLKAHNVFEYMHIPVQSGSNRQPLRNTPVPRALLCYALVTCNVTHTHSFISCCRGSHFARQMCSSDVCPRCGPELCPTNRALLCTGC